MHEKLWRLDDPDWVKRRKIMWTVNKDLYAGGDPRPVANAIKAYFLSGKKENVYAPNPYIPQEQECLWDWDSEEGALNQLLLLPSAEPEIIGELTKKACANGDIIKILMSFLNAHGGKGALAGESASSEYGYMDGIERDILKILLPNPFDHAAWQQEIAENFINGRRYLSPLDAFNIMVECGYGFLTHYAANPHHPIQDFIDYWRQAMPYFKFDDQPHPAVHLRLKPERKCTDAKQAATEFCQAVRFFREPRGLPNEDTPAKRFRDRLYDILENGTGCAELDEVWKFTATEAGRRLVRVHPGDFYPKKILFNADQHNPSVIRKIYECWHEMGGVNEIFDPDKFKVMDVGRVLHAEIVKLFGYEEGASVPAYHYIFKVADSFYISPADDLTVYINLFWLIPHPSHVPGKLTPRVIARQTSSLADYSVFSGLNSLSERQVYWRLHKEKNISFIRADGDWMSKGIRIPKQFIITECGVERFMVVSSTGLEADGAFVESLDEETGRVQVTINVSPWSGKQSNVDITQFRMDVMED